MTRRHEGVVASIVAIVLVLVFFSTGGCTDERGTTELLTLEGYTDIQVTGYRWFACGRDDIAATGFVATNANRQRVRGVVCRGFMKAKTLRIDGPAHR
jgi:hypothetical protein